MQHKLYDQVAAAHFGKPIVPPSQDLFFLKEFDGNSFLTNGYDYFFSTKSLNWDLKRCCAVLLLDYFNAKIKDKPFSKLSKSKVQIIITLVDFIFFFQRL